MMGSISTAFGLAVAGQTQRSPKDLELPVLDALHAIRFVGAKSSISKDFNGMFRMDSVPAPILRAWVGVHPGELAAAIDRLKMLGYVEVVQGDVSIPFAESKAQVSKDGKRVNTREIIIEKPDGTHVSICHVIDDKTETVLAMGGTHSDGKFLIKDPCVGLFDVRPRGQMVCYKLSPSGLRKLEEQSQPPQKV